MQLPIIPGPTLPAHLGDHAPESSAIAFAGELHLGLNTSKALGAKCSSEQAKTGTSPTSINNMFGSRSSRLDPMAAKVRDRSRSHA